MKASAIGVDVRSHVCHHGGTLHVKHPSVQVREREDGRKESLCVTFKLDEEKLMETV